MIDLAIVLLISVLAVAVYWNSLPGEFVFDDTSLAEVLMPEILEHRKRHAQR